MHIADRDKCNWLRERIELVEQPQATKDEKMHMFDRLSWSSLFETFMANKYAAAKRFGLEGCETLIPAMKTLIDRSAELGTEAVCMGMPHRGQLLSVVILTEVYDNNIAMPVPQYMLTYEAPAMQETGWRMCTPSTCSSAMHWSPWHAEVHSTFESLQPSTTGHLSSMKQVSVQSPA